ncbi:hypothetical protein BASA81_018595 [Batrachochytrium salamandrivorans]|nr:hypothetical protein BASA81_018595 [Batrachochytrium salamandrivorans]
MPSSIIDLEAAHALAKSDPEKAVTQYKALLESSIGKSDDEVKIRESSITKLGELYKDLNKADDLAALIRSSHDFLLSISKAKTAKIVRTLIDQFSEIPNSLPLQVEVCKETIQWAVTEKRIFLRQSLETRLCGLYLDNKLYSESLALISSLLKELKRLDDKNVLVEVQLLESRVFHALKNLAKSRASLTSARTSANAIYCPPLMQAALDMQSGILHAEERDYKTAYSYFYETLEGYASLEDSRATSALKYMLLCKIMTNLSEDVLAKYKDELSNDPIVRAHLSFLYDTLLDQNLLRIIEPYSRVEISHIAALVKLPTFQVETKLSQMILDKVFLGILDQGAGCLEVFEEQPADKTYEATLDTIKNVGNVVESLYEKAGQLTN